MPNIYSALCEKNRLSSTKDLEESRWRWMQPMRSNAHHYTNLPCSRKSLQYLREAEPLLCNVPIDSSNPKCSWATEETSTASACNQWCRLRYMLDQESTIGCITANLNAVHSGGQQYAALHVMCNSVPMKFKVYIGAEINVIPITAFDELADSHMNRLKPGPNPAIVYSGNVVPTTGPCQIECKLRQRPFTLECFIADTSATPILGFVSCRAMGLLKIENRILKMTDTEVAALKSISQRKSPRI